MHRKALKKIPILRLPEFRENERLLILHCRFQSSKYHNLKIKSSCKFKKKFQNKTTSPFLLKVHSFADSFLQINCESAGLLFDELRPSHNPSLFGSFPAPHGLKIGEQIFSHWSLTHTLLVFLPRLEMHFVSTKYKPYGPGIKIDNPYHVPDGLGFYSAAGAC